MAGIAQHGHERHSVDKRPAQRHETLLGDPQRMHSLDLVREKLSCAARTLARLKRPALESQKAHYEDLQRDDFLWHYLLQSFATMGGVSGWNGLIGDETNYRQMSFEALGDVPAANRMAHVSAICVRAKVRYPQRKAEYITGCHDKIQAVGGPRVAKERLLQQPGRDAKIVYLRSFPGIGEKYARNIMMDVYHDDFRDSIAIDSRIQAISTEWELTFKSYADHESFYLSVARAAGINGWELDRLMFGFQTVFYPPISIDA
jgi:thermostable 8-oxoguanine DNA glycosylase